MEVSRRKRPPADEDLVENVTSVPGGPAPTNLDFLSVFTSPPLLFSEFGWIKAFGSALVCNKIGLI